MTKKCIKVNDISNEQYSVNNNVRSKTPILRPDLWDFSDAYIAMKGGIAAIGISNAKKRNKKLKFNNN